MDGRDELRHDEYYFCFGNNSLTGTLAVILTTQLFQAMAPRKAEGPWIL